MIKKVGAILFTFLLLHAQAFALVGGPWDNALNVFGTYSAVMIPDFDRNIEEVDLDPNDTPDDPSDDLDPRLADPGRNSLGLFAFVLPTQGFGEGYCIIFQEGVVFGGDLAGLGDPDTGRIRGLIRAELDVAFSGGVASGYFDTQLVENKERSLFAATQRLEGEAVITVRGDVFRDLDGDPTTAPTVVNAILSTIYFKIDGYKASENTDISVVEAPAIVSGGGGGGTTP